MDFQERRRASSPASSGEAAASSPGKRTLSEGLPIQHKAAGAPVADAAVAAPAALPTLNLRDVPVQRKAAAAQPDGTPAPAPTPAGAGTPMPAPVQLKMERAMNADFSAVRVHEGPQAQGMGALAYTQGNDIHFAPGQYQPETQQGQELLGHELAHVTQQAQGRVAATTQAKGVAINDDAGLEREADEMGARAARGEGGGAPASAGASAAAPGGAIQRRPGGNPAQTDGSPGGGASGAGTGSGTGAPVDASTTGGAPAGDPTADACPDPAEQERINAFRMRTDLQVLDNIPSPGTGKFDARYYPLIGLMPVTVKIHFDFVQADDTPDLAGLMGRVMSGQGVSQFFWADAEKTAFRDQFVARCSAKWSAQHVLRSTKPCWTFFATPIVTPVPTDDQATAHYAITVHKSSGPGIDYKSGLSRVQLTDPTAQPTGNLWQSDVQESSDFRSGGVARDERLRLERELAAAAASPVQFGRDQDAVDSAAAGKLSTFAAAANRANPSAPMIPIEVTGFASAEGDPAHNQALSERRATNVAAVLSGAGVRQPVHTTGRGATGAPNAAANRRAEVAVDQTFETSYNSNHYAVGEHEFGHMLGNLDEYQNQTTGATGTRQTKYSALITSAGLQHPQWSDDSSSIMSAGVDVLPRHYVSLWEALGRMTDPDITQAQWSFQ